MPCPDCQPVADRARFLEASNDELRRRAHEAEAEAERLREHLAFRQLQVLHRSPPPALL